MKPLFGDPFMDFMVYNDIYSEEKHNDQDIEFDVFSKNINNDHKEDEDDI